MKLNELLSPLRPLRIVRGASAADDTDITLLTADSRKVCDPARTVFVAVRGTTVDGHTFLTDLARKGPLGAAVVEELPAGGADPDTTYVVVDDTARALGLLASRWYGDPSRSLSLVGVTGTNGKTTTATLLYEMARMTGRKAGLLSTVANYIDGQVEHATQTTPDPLTINALLRRMVDAGCSFAAMEVSSHAAHQKRIAGLAFAGGVFTNLTRDHMDYHKTVQNYLNAKKSFFDALPAEAFALTNIDDPVGPVMVQNTRARRRTYALRQEADYRGRIMESRLDGTLLELNGHAVETLFTGRFNAYNLTAVYGASLLLGWDPGQVLLNMSRLVPVAGRFQALHSPGGVTAIVDYAHTPDAVANVLQAIREVTRNHGGRIITVVGAGGNRDKGKRPIMAAEAARRSDMVVLTSDNPRFEVPEEIIRDMEAGVAHDAELASRTVSITDRAAAIERALAEARPGDVVLVAGKGHEDYQEVRGVKHHFDDREAVLDAMKALDARNTPQ